MNTQHDFDVSFEVDHDTGEFMAAYFRVRKGRAAETKKFSRGNVYADYDRHGNLLGVELLAPCQVSVFDQLAEPELRVKHFLKRSLPRHLIQPKLRQRASAK